MKYSRIKNLMVSTTLVGLASCVTPSVHDNNLRNFMGTSPTEDYLVEKKLGNIHKVVGYRETPFLLKGSRGISEEYKHLKTKVVQLENVKVPEVLDCDDKSAYIHLRNDRKVKRLATSVTIDVNQTTYKNDFVGTTDALPTLDITPKNAKRWVHEGKNSIDLEIDK
jgi:hypothetical protein